MLPGWGSLDVTAAYARWFTYAGFAALFLLGVFEILGHVYGVHETSLRESARLRDEDNRRAEANAKIVEAQRDAAEASAKAEGFRLDIAKANESAAKAEARAAEANLELEKFKAPRTLTDKQVSDIAHKLKPFAGQEFDVTPYWDNPESLGIANRIADALVLSGWKYVKPEKSSFMFGGKVGVQVWAHPNADSPTKMAVSTLLSALNDEGLSAVPKVQNPGGTNVKHNKISLSIGLKP